MGFVVFGVVFVVDRSRDLVFGCGVPLLSFGYYVWGVKLLGRGFWILNFRFGFGFGFLGCNLREIVCREIVGSPKCYDLGILGFKFGVRI